VKTARSASFSRHSAPEPLRADAATERSARTAAPQMSRWPRVATISAALVAAAVFGPYTALPGVRTEQLAVYASVLLLLPLAAAKLRLSVKAAATLFILVTVLLFSLLAALLPFGGVEPYARGALLPGIDNLLLPVAVVLLVHLWLALGATRTALFNIFSKVLVLGALLNAALTIASTQVDLSDRLQMFWGQPGAAESVAVQAAALGRFSGIFNQPAEAGLFYGAAVIVAIQLLQRRPVLLAAVTAVLVVGGAASVSKVFLLVALPIGLWRLGRVAGVRGRLLLSAAGLGGLGLLFSRAGLLPSWEGSARLAQLLSPESDYVNFYSAGRFGQGGSVTSVMLDVVTVSPWAGFGASGLVVPYDSLWLEALVVAGLFGVLGNVLVLLLLSQSFVVKGRAEGNGDFRGVGGALVLLVIGASFGLPSLTANRASTVVWVLLTLTLLTAEHAQRQPSAAAEGQLLATGRRNANVRGDAPQEGVG